MKKLYVGSLPYSISDESLLQLFADSPNSLAATIQGHR
jgi:hypothetical protein